MNAGAKLHFCRTYFQPIIHIFLMKVKNIIFDLGNVLIDLDIPHFNKTTEALFGNEYEYAMKEAERRNIWDIFEVGGMSEENFIWNFQNIAKKKQLQPYEIIKAWNSMLGQIHPARFDMLERLKKKYNLYIFSNTNSIHIEWVNRYLKREYKSSIPDFEKKYFEKVYYSHIIRARKPNVDGFLHILNDADLIAEETLFIDDKIENIEGAKLAGMQGLHHPVGTEIVEVLKGF